MTETKKKEVGDERDLLELKRMEKHLTPENADGFTAPRYAQLTRTWDVNQTTQFGMAVLNTFHFFTEEGRDAAEALISEGGV